MKAQRPSPSATDYEHPERDFFQKFHFLGLGQTNLAENFLGVWDIFGRFISTHCFPSHMHNQPLFLQKSEPVYPNSKY
jgi:hypothetical protein